MKNLNMYLKYKISDIIYDSKMGEDELCETVFVYIKTSQIKKLEDSNMIESILSKKFGLNIINFAIVVCKENPKVLKSNKKIIISEWYSYWLFT